MQNVVVNLTASNIFLEPLEIKAVRANERSPFAKTTITKQQIEKENLGQDIPFLLNKVPSVVINSDAGNGIGYTGIRIRGADATRINVTLNGIPYNDAESQGTYFVDLPDLASSVNSIQVQRGVGTSTNGAGAFGATINLSTNEVNQKAYGEINNSYGSYNSWKHTAKIGSGLINDHFTIDARLSQLSSDGYIERAATKLNSFYISGAYLAKTSSIRLNVFSGKEKTYQAWNGVAESMLNINRRFNSAGTDKPGTPYDNETDNYQQNHYQLFYNQQLPKNWSLQVSGFLTRGFGYYEQYKAAQKYSSYGLANPMINGAAVTKTDLVRQLWLDNYFYGNNNSLQYKKADNELTIGTAWNQYDGKHYGKIIWANTGIFKDYKWYDLIAKKTDVSAFAKWQHTISKNLSTYIDAQWRHVDYTMNGFRDNPTLHIARKFDFFNPKLGISYSSNNWQSYLSYAKAGKEPNRDDFEAAPNQQPSPETLHDFEIGTAKKFKHANIAVNGFYMLYKDQLILTGKINDVGAYTRTNVANSYRAGFELQGTAEITNWFTLDANATISTNKVKDFTEYFDNYDLNKQEAVVHRNTDIAFSPKFIGNINANFKPCANTSFQLMNKYVSKQYLDNTGNNARTLDAFFVQDLRFDHQITGIKNLKVNLVLQVNNLLSAKYEPNGYTFSYIYGGDFTTENYYFPMAQRNFMAAIQIKF
jgi:iron complex outermembrane receptor protein